MKKGFKAYIAKLSKALLVPVSLIAGASLLLAFGSIVWYIVGFVPAIDCLVVEIIGDALCYMGLLVLQNLHVIYAVALTFSFATERKEYAGFAGLVGYIAFVWGMSLALVYFPSLAEMYPEGSLVTIMGVETVNCNVVGGIISGLICAGVFNKLRHAQLPKAFAFFNGVRFTPLACIAVMYTIGIFFPFAWVWISLGIDKLANAMSAAGMFGPFIYGTVERILIPTGLHQIWNTVIRSTAVSGEYVFASGAIAVGYDQASAMYLAEGLPVSPAGVTLAEIVKFGWGPQMPIMLGALPGICLAMYHCADKDKRADVKSLYSSSALTAFTSAVSEPVEFLFVFNAPLLYFLIYAPLNGLSWMLCYALGSGVDGDANIFGLLINILFRPETKWIVVVILTVVYFAICYFLFKWWIVKFDVKTPGRGGSDYDEQVALAQEVLGVEKQANVDSTDPKVLKAQLIIKALGGKENIKEIEACFTRLRVVLNDKSKFDEATIKTTGCNGVSHPNENEVQIVYGAAINMIFESVSKQLEKM